MIRTFDTVNNQAVVSPVYFIDNEKEEIIAEENWTYSPETLFFFPGHESNLMVENQHKSSDVSQIKIITRKVDY